MPRTLRTSFPILISSVVNPDPSGSNRSTWGSTLNAMVRPNTSPAGRAARSGRISVSTSSWSLSTCSASSRTHLIPIPDTDWYEEVTRNRRPNRLCNGPRGISAVMAVQFPLATMPLWLARASGLISGTTKGTSGSIRKAEELSTHTVPAAAAAGAIRRATVPPAEVRARSIPSNQRSCTPLTVISPPRKASRFPSERGEANATASSRRKFRSSNSCRIVRSTAPVAPTTATRMSSSYEQGPPPRWNEGSAVLPDPPAVLAQAEPCVHRADGSLGVPGPDHAGHPDRGRRDHLDIDALFGEGGEHLGNHRGVALDPRADQRDPGHVVVDPVARPAHLADHALDHR